MLPGTTRDEALADINRQEADDGRVFVSDKTTGEMTGMGTTWRADQRRRGKIKTIRVGNRRMDLVSSVYALMRDLVNDSYAEDGSITPIRRPKTEFKPKPRKPTPQELAALARANEARRAEAQKRRELRGQQAVSESA